MKESTPFMLDAVVLSDIHLGSDNCQARSLCHFLESLQADPRATRRLILNGDVFDSIDFRRLKKSHWRVLSLLRKLSNDMEIIWICGNHDGSAEIISHLLGVTVVDEYILESGHHRILILHGHVYDRFIEDHPFLTYLADCIYLLLQKIDTSHTWAKRAKKGSKTFLRCAQVIEEKSMAHAAQRGCTAVCCGHTHHALARAEGVVAYYNSGCWTEKPCTYLTVANGAVELHLFKDRPEVVETMLEVAIAQVTVELSGVTEPGVRAATVLAPPSAR
jgi:UDP-2,3-diacylglucosamine pyrophosphatase LpxH